MAKITNPLRVMHRMSEVERIDYDPFLLDIVTVDTALKPDTDTDLDLTAGTEVLSFLYNLILTGCCCKGSLRPPSRFAHCQDKKGAMHRRREGSLDKNQW